MMNTQQPNIPSCISRSAFQRILHQALISNKQQRCIGLLGVDDSSGCIHHIKVADSVDKARLVLLAWKQSQVKCIGLFHMLGSEDPSFLLGVMPTGYIKLSVDLDEKGRLDLLAALCDKLKGSQVFQALDLIEDGHKAVAA